MQHRDVCKADWCTIGRLGLNTQASRAVMDPTRARMPPSQTWLGPCPYQCKCHRGHHTTQLLFRAHHPILPHPKIACESYGIAVSVHPSSLHAWQRHVPPATPRSLETAPRAGPSPQAPPRDPSSTPPPAPPATAQQAGTAPASSPRATCTTSVLKGTPRRRRHSRVPRPALCPAAM